MAISAELKDELQRFNRKWAKPLFQVAVALLLGIAIVSFWRTTVGQRFDFFFLEKFHDLRGPLPPPNDVILVSIDSEAYEKLEQSTNFPLPRHYLADALERIIDASPKVVILDAKIPNERTIDPAADLRIEEALKKGPTTIWSGAIPTDLSDPVAVLNLPSDERFRKAAKLELSMAVYGVDNVLAYVANPNTQTKGLAESVPVAQALVELGKFPIHTPGRRDLINFYGPPGTIKRISIYELIAGDVQSAQALIKDKVVLLGYQSAHYAKATTNKDSFLVTGSDLPMYGVEVHGNIVGNLLHGTFLKRFSTETEVLVVILSVFIVASFAMHSPTFASMGIILGAALGAIVSAYYLFSRYQFWLSGIGSFLVATAVIFVISAFYFFRRSQLYKRYIDRTMGFKREREL